MTVLVGITKLCRNLLGIRSPKLVNWPSIVDCMNRNDSRMRVVISLPIAIVPARVARTKNSSRSLSGTCWRTSATSASTNSISAVIVERSTRTWPVGVGFAGNRSAKLVIVKPSSKGQLLERFDPSTG